MESVCECLQHCCCGCLEDAVFCFMHHNDWSTSSFDVVWLQLAEGCATSTTGWSNSTCACVVSIVMIWTISSTSTLPLSLFVKSLKTILLACGSTDLAREPLWISEWRYVNIQLKLQIALLKQYQLMIYANICELQPLCITLFALFGKICVCLCTL